MLSIHLILHNQVLIYTAEWTGESENAQTLNLYVYAV